jgi:hypothetical protein
MAQLEVLQHARIFPPKPFLVAVWIGTLGIAIYGVIVTPAYNGPLLMWSVIAGVALWQLLALRWVQLDNEGIRMRNILQRGRELRWEEITEFREEEVRLSKHPYVVLHLSNMAEGTSPVTRMKLTSDQVEFETLRTIIREGMART